MDERRQPFRHQHVQEIIDNFEEKTGSVSFPGMFYYNIEDYQARRPNEFYDYKTGSINQPYEERVFVDSYTQYDPGLFVPEFAFIDGDFLIPEEMQRLYHDHNILGRSSGMTHYYMFMLHAKKIKNLIFRSKVHVLESPDRTQTKKQGNG